MRANKILISTSFALMASTALSQTTRDQIVEELTQQGFERIEISRTLFGNLRFEATGAGIEREIILGKDGTVVRDRSERDDEGDDESDDEGDDFDDENDDDEENDDHESDEDGGDNESDDSESDSDRGGDSEGDSESDSGGDSDGEGDSDSEGDD